MALVQPAKQKVADWIQDKSPQLKCPACGKGNFGIGHLVNVFITPNYSAGPAGIEIPTNPSIPLVQIVCMDCRFVMFLDGSVSGAPS